MLTIATEHTLPAIDFFTTPSFIFFQLQINKRHNSGPIDCTTMDPYFSAPMLDQKIEHNLLHDVKPIPSGFVYQYPDTSLKGSIQLFADKEFNLRKFCRHGFIISLGRHAAAPHKRQPHRHIVALFLRKCPKPNQPSHPACRDLHRQSTPDQPYQTRRRRR